ncbi:MAG: DNA topoisomerase 4 subunit A [Acidimicrobiaceae bacterium]|nr:DNA topoisomerase 4 subunit A [Acidimicrobiaceae bacterium]
MSVQQQMILDSDPRARQVVDVPLAEEMSNSFLAYGLSVITSRAIPDVRDGLKPVQRRILWSMFQMGVRPDTPFRKSARIVGDTMGRYHPHGDAAIYDSLVRLGQDFSRRVALVAPQGNFGSLDDPAAAPRYTECRLSEAAMDLVGEVEEETVDFRPTYDGEGLEPEVFPATFPNLLVNGTAGIAVGMATNMTPHNLREVGAAVELVLQSQARGKTVTTDELLKVVPGPDFPGGGRVVDQGLRQVYESGRGPIRTQACVEIKRITKLRESIIVTELPYQVGPENVISKIAKLVEAGRLVDVAGVADLTDTEGLNIHIKLKPKADAHAVLAALYKLTPLEDTFYANNVVLVDGVPTTLGLRDLCEHYIKHRLEVIVRRTHYRRRKARSRLEIVEGLIVALDHIDAVVALIRRSRSPSKAHRQLMSSFDLTDKQATRVLSMQLRRLTALERQKLTDEAESLKKMIADYEQILDSERLRRKIVRDELRRIIKDHGAPRKSEIVSAFEADDLQTGLDLTAASASKADNTTPGDNTTKNGLGGDHPVISVGPSRDIACIVTMSISGHLGRAPISGARRTSPGVHDLLAARVETSTAAPLALVTSEGRGFVIRAGEAADASNRLRGTPVASMLGLAKDERVLALVTAGDERLMVVTASGMARRLKADTVLGVGYGDPVINLDPDDRVVSAFLSDDNVDAVIVSDDAKALRVPLVDFSLDSRNARGAMGMRLQPGAEVVAAGAVNARNTVEGPAEGVVVVATSTGGLKATWCSELTAQRSGGRGVFIVKLAGGEHITASTILAPSSSSGVPGHADTNPAFDAGTGVNEPAEAASADASWLSTMKLMALKTLDGDPRKLDKRPVVVHIEPTKRYTKPKQQDRKILSMALARW